MKWFFLSRSSMAILTLVTTAVFAQTSADPAEFNVEALNARGQAEGWTFKVKGNWVLKHLRNGGSIQDVTGLQRPTTWQENAKFVDVQAAVDLPASFDWRTKVEGGLQPIKNQGQCGSCWAFATTAMLESLSLIHNEGKRINLSEQAAVSCSGSGSCRGGYFDVLNYMKRPGMPDETQFPYVAYDKTCKRDLKPIEKIATWAYVGSPNRQPTIEQLKTALMTYGPLAVSVNGSFSSYASGIFNACNSGATDHMVNLEGWSDEDGGYWIMRNSWGENWGEKGYMRIRYTGRSGKKCNNIGEMAAFATYLPAAP